MMKIIILLAQCMSSQLKYSLQTIIKVLEELDVSVHKVELNKLPYFDGKKNREMDKIVQAIAESKGVIAISNVPMLGMHGAMQSFFDTASIYSADHFNKPMLTVTYSEWLGEYEAASQIQRCWNIIGGYEGGKVCLNKQIQINQIKERLEREVEDFYRLIKQERMNVISTERYIFTNSQESAVMPITSITINNEKSEGQGEIRSFASLLKGEENKVSQSMEVEKVTTPPTQGTRINLSTKEQTIKEIATLLQKEVDEDEFKSIHTGVYTKPPQYLTGMNSMKRIQQIPHYFIAQYDKSLALNLKYHITDLNEEGYIVIENGDCTFKEEIQGVPTVEMILSEEILQSILSKKLTYQKAFMLGKLKVKGNFAVLPKLDQVFKAL